MAELLDDLVLFPHCDLHLALTGTPPLTLSVLKRTETAGTVAPYTLTPVARADCTFEFMSPYRATGDRFDGLPTVDANGVVQPNEIGVFLFQVTVGDQYVVGRLQVHQRMLGWWFGNDTLTTALDPVIGHALPSVYARFSDDDNAADLVGDISGHGYVTLTSQDPTRVQVTANGRLRGLVETPKPPPGELPALVDVTGTFGTTPPRNLPVAVVDYRKDRPVLVDQQIWDVRDLDNMQNVVLLSEGFEDTPADRAMFDKAVNDTVADVFSVRRHEPYGVLKERFNVFSVFEESFQRGVTCSHQVVDKAGGPPRTGLLVPYERRAAAARPNNRHVYTVAELVHRVGLPPRVDVRPNLLEVWKHQGLTDFDPARVDAALIRTWKEHRSPGLLQTRDTFFGVCAGARLADRTSGRGVVSKPPRDDVNDPAMVAFIRRLYTFWDSGPTGLFALDPRRHPPELNAGGLRTNPLNSVQTYASRLSYVGRFSRTTYKVGPVWAPDDTRFRRSRGLIALVVCDFVGRGVNLNNNTMTLQNFNSKQLLLFDFDTRPGHDPAEMRRAVPAPNPAKVDTDDLVDTLAHEFGHNFNLGDEYEDYEGDGPDSSEDLVADNISLLGYLRPATARDRSLDINKVKWLDLPRMRYSARLVRPSEALPNGSGIRVGIDPAELADWRKVQGGENKVCLRQFQPTREGKQLPLEKLATPRFLEDANIGDIRIDRGVGTLVLTGGGLTPPFQVFDTGSVLYVPLKDGRGTPLTAVDSRVLAFLRQHPAPLNRNPDRRFPSAAADTPKAITGLTARELRRTLIGVYEGAQMWAGAHYRPSGACKMRASGGAGELGSFCYVCMWLLVNRIDPGRHAFVSRMFYPGRTR